MTNLTKKEAYLAMFSFLEDYYAITKSDEVGSLLGSMSFLQDGGTADPAIWDEWEQAVSNVKAGKVDALLRLKK